VRRKYRKEGGQTMKPTGIVRGIDELGRVVLPKSLREVLDIKEKDSVEIFTDGDCIILKKYNPGCSICGELSDLAIFKEKKFCRKCISELNEMSSSTSRRR
jgi:transcriptional pleiotropic regulator of transition state genes